MENCREILAALTDYLEGDLTGDEARAFEKHMQGCPPCEAFFRTFRKSSEMARDALRVSDIPGELQDRIRGFLRHRLGLKTPGRSADA